MLDLNITPGRLGEFPPATKPHPGFFHEVGETRFRQLVDDHYEMIRESDIANLFPIMDDEEFDEAKKHAQDFLIQISGGPNYFEQNRGESRMVGRHAPFRIDEAGRQTWLRLYSYLLPDLVEEGITEAYVQSFWDYLDIHSIWMINTP